MSAIAGILNFHGAPLEPDLIEKLTGAMKRRGPDAQTHRVQGSVALGHCMLRTTPEAIEEHQPLASQDKNLVLVFDGRLDNRDELRRDLIATGAMLRGNTDAELALQAYAAWGEDCPRKLLGDFAFAVWDARRRRLFCALDHMGARPFYYALTKQFFAFASEEEALLELPGVSHQPNEAMILHMLVPAYHSADNQRFWLKDVWGLQPGQCMSISADGTHRSETYWRLEPGDESVYASDQECEEAFLDVFGEAVRCRMRATGDIAAMMSGGMDSASIAAMVKRLLPDMPGKAFHTYSAISDHPESCVESRCIQSLTKDWGDNAHFVSVPSFTGMVDVDDLLEIAWARPHPCDNSIVLPAMMALAASRQGQRVMLHGAGGDLAMHVPERYAAYLLRAGQWRIAWGECQRARRNNTYLQGSSPVLLLLLNAWTAWMPAGIKALMRRMRRGNPLAGSVANPGFAEKLHLTERLHKQEAQANRPFSANIQQDHAAVLNAAWGPVLGLTGFERVAGRYGVELRDPWADKRVAEFFLRLPLMYKVHDGWTKYLARNAFAADLEDSVRWRIGKEHLGWQFTVRLMEESDALMGPILEPDLATAGEYVDIDTVRAHLESYKTALGSEGQELFYETMTLMLWLRRIAG
jgi:asparagine synthase (glutamine-hydrolysing)